MNIPLRTPISKLLALILSLVVITVYLALASSQFLAYRLGEKTDLKSLVLAARLEPWDAEYQYKVGRLLTLMLRTPEAADAFSNATKLNPYSSTYWLKFASAQDVLGQAQAKRQALQRAIAVDSKSTQVAWEAGNSYLTAGDFHSAFRQFRAALQGEPTLSGEVIPLCWRVMPDVDALLQQAIPPVPAVYSSFLEFLVSRKDTASAARVWTQIVMLGQSERLSDLFDYVRYLIGQNQPAQARKVWVQAGPLSGLQNYQPSQQNLVVNGDFSFNVLDGGFDWAYEKRSDVNLEIDPTQPHLGPRSLLISYDSRGLDDSGIHQIIPVEPNNSYHFSAYFKTQHLEGAGGPKFILQDYYTQKLCFESGDLKDSDDWKPVNGDFQTGSETRLLALQIRRVPSGSAIRGKLWIDGIRLTPRNQRDVQ